MEPPPPSPPKKKSPLKSTLVSIAAALAVMAVLAAIQTKINADKSSSRANEDEVASLTAKLVELERENRRLKSQPPSPTEASTSPRTEIASLTKAAVLFPYLKHKIRHGEPYAKELAAMMRLSKGHKAVQSALKPLVSDSVGGVAAFVAMREHAIAYHHRGKDDKGDDKANADKKYRGKKGRDDGGKAGETSIWSEVKNYLGTLARFINNDDSRKKADEAAAKDAADAEAVLKIHRQRTEAVKKQLKLATDAIVGAFIR